MGVPSVRGGGGACVQGRECERREGGVVGSAAELQQRLPGAAERPGLAKVGRGAQCKAGAGAPGLSWGPHLARRGRIPPGTIHGGESWWRWGVRHTVPWRPNRAGTAPPERYRGGGRSWAPGL